MHKLLAISTLLLFCLLSQVQAQVTGLWYNVDDKDGKAKSHLEVFEQNGKLYAKVVKLLPAATTRTCSNCDGDRKNKPIEGMTIMWGLDKVDGKTYEDGEIIDPATGKIYSCDVALESQDKLKVRGYIGFSLLGRSQYWYRVK